MIQEFDHLVPQIHPEAWVHDGAWIIGDVLLARGVNVWPTAVLRGDMGAIRVGEFTNLQDGVICHDTGGKSETVVGARVTVGHRAILHGCRVEDDCLVGMGSIVMDNAIVGSGSIVGAGAVVPAGRVIPPGSLVLGSPARVVRAVTDAEREWIAYSWQVYLERAEVWRGVVPGRSGPRSE
jgi:carbonic anhydrase/acetyltransferase-like protein (isoleucine patch superfamily)